MRREAANVQIQVLAVELEKPEAEDLAEVGKEVGSGYHVRYFNDRQCCGWISWNNSVSNWPALSL